MKSLTLKLTLSAALVTLAAVVLAGLVAVSYVSPACVPVTTLAAVLLGAKVPQWVGEAWAL
jgi:hypothetical protein